MLAGGGRCLRCWRGRQGRPLGQAGGELGGDGLGLAAREVTDQGDHRVAGGVGAGVEGGQLGAVEGRDALQGAVARRGIGVRAVQLLEQGDAGQLAGVLLLLLEAGEDLVLQPRQGGVGEVRCTDHLGEQRQRRFALFGGRQAAQRGDRHVAVGAVAELGAEALEAGGDRGGVAAVDALVEHGVGQHGQAGRGAVLAAAGGEGQAQVEHRQLAGLDEQHAGAFGGFPALDVEVAAGQGLAVDAGQRGDLRRRGRCAAGDGCRGGRLIRFGHRATDQQQQAEQDQQRQGEQQVAFIHGGSPRWSARCWPAAAPEPGSGARAGTGAGRRPGCRRG
ncbi:hypothetical protein D3C75_693680 [compost metagenome]